MTYKPFVKVPNLTQAGCTRQNRPGRDALIDLGHGSPTAIQKGKVATTFTASRAPATVRYQVKRR